MRMLCRDLYGIDDGDVVHEKRGYRNCNLEET
jgi:hypothetical protein